MIVWRSKKPRTLFDPVIAHLDQVEAGEGDGCTGRWESAQRSPVGALHDPGELQLRPRTLAVIPASSNARSGKASKSPRAYAARAAVPIGPAVLGSS